MHSHEFRCGACHRMKNRSGSGLRFILGIQTRVCMGCRQAIEARGAPPKTRPKTFVIGANGKRIKLPQGQQAKFTSAHNVKALPVGIERGFDERYELSPEEVEALKYTGEFSAEWRRLRGLA